MLKTTWAPLIVALIVAHGVAYAQQGAPTRVEFHLEAQPLSDAVAAWAQQAGFQLVWPAGDEAAKQIAPRVAGRYDREEALQLLLKGTGLTYSFVNADTVTIWPETQPKQSGNQTAMNLVQAGAPSEPVRENAVAKKDENNTVQEIIVTAQKRQERLQDVPISISVLDGKDLDRSTFEGVTEALRTIPGVMTTATIQGGGTQLAIRGVAAANPVFNGPSPTAYYLDSVSLNLAKTAVVPDTGLYDLERVEVLRGPQGTLYGAGGMGGVVRVLTHGADLNAFDFKARTSISSTQDSDALSYRGDMAVNVPIIPGALAARATVSYQDIGGWIDRPFKKDANDGRNVNARLKVRAQPTEQLSLDLTAWTSRSDNSNAAYSGNNRTIVRGTEEPVDTDYDIYGLTVGYDFSRFSVRNTSSYIDYVNDSIIDTTALGGVLIGFRQLTHFGDRVFSDEINLNSTTEGNWRWSLGGMYRDSTDKTFIHIPGFGAPTLSTEESKSFAVYGEATRLLMDRRLELTAGLRYFEDKLVSSTLAQSNYARATFEAVTPRIVLTAHASERVTAYASYSEGFRSGYTQSQGAASATFPAVEPDELSNYEVGMKGNGLGGWLDFEAAAYFIDWSDTQQALLIGSGPNGGPPYAPAGVNAKSASGPGFEVSLNAHFTSGVTLSAGYGWNDLTFDEDVTSGGVFLYPKGNRLNFSAESTANASIGYDFPLGGGGFEGRLSTSASYSSALPIRRVSAAGLFISTGDSLTFARAAFEVGSPGERWRASLFVDNLTNEGGAFLKNFLGVQDFDMYARPRTIGMQFEYRAGR